MFSLAFIVTIAALFSQNSLVSAQGCWRDTPCTGPAQAAFQNPKWEQYNYSPASRNVNPVKVMYADKSVAGNYPINNPFNGDNQILIYDFGKETGGIVHLSYTSNLAGRMGLAFSEAVNWVGVSSDDSNGSFRPDGAIFFDLQPGGGTYTMPVNKIRGGFRYLTLFTVTGSTATTQLKVDVTNVTVEIGFQPDWQNLRAYQGYFWSSDVKLNKIWYAGAYTLQTNAIPPSTGRHFPILGGGWENDAQLNIGTSGSTIYVDGSKRDRTVWSGDLTVAIPSIMVSTGDFDGVRNTLQVLFNDQQSDGALPFAGPAINIYNSDTYHMATLIGTHDYFLHTNDKSFLSGIWNRYKLAMSFITAKIDSSGSLYVTGTDDWGRIGQGAHNTEAQMLLYRTLRTSSDLAKWQGDNTNSGTWAAMADKLKGVINSVYYDSSAGAFKNSDVDTSVYPEDANSLALLYSAADDSKMSTISRSLTKNWGPIGAICPELPNNIVTFIMSIEIKGHFVARQATRALDLIRRSWGWYLDNPLGTQSTTIEGYRDDGTFGYRAETGYGNDYSYTSHAHGWGTGPTDALTSYLVGLRITEPGGSAWILSPQFGDVSNAEAGFTTPLGKFSAAWLARDDGFHIGWATPESSTGTLVLPAKGRNPTITQTNGSGSVNVQSYVAARDVVIVNVVGSGELDVTY